MSDLIDWLHEKLADTEKALRAREQMQESWREGTDAEWEAAAQMHPSTAGRPVLNKAERLRTSEAHGRIAYRLRHDVEMFRRAIAAVTSRKAP